MKKTCKEDAVSPVIGVMLMLVVTIIIAAVVSAFAGGIAGDGAKTAPAAAISVGFMRADGGMGGAPETKMVFEHLSGDAILTKDIEIVTYYTLPDGEVIKHTQAPSSEAMDLYGSGTTFARVPFINDMRGGYAGNNPPKDFGNYTWQTGDILSTGGDKGTSGLLGFDITNTENEFGSGSVVDVKILHTPSGKYIYDKEVIVI